MRGLNRTRPLKLDHPGLDTAATRDGPRLLIQNDIGTNDAHVLVLQVEGLQTTLTYSDLHRQRFGFLQGLLTEAGAAWSVVEARTTPGLNAGEAHHVGAERLVLTAMAARGEGVFRPGDRLDEVLGAAPAVDLLVESMVLASQAPQRGQPVALVADEARLLLARRLLGRRSEFELLQEHAGLCHALAQGLRDGLAHGVERDAHAAEKLAAQAKAWERQADHLVMRARARAERQPQWLAFARLIERSDDVADALEEATFVLSLVADDHHHGWGKAVLSAMRSLAGAVLVATQDHVKALAVAATLDQRSEAADHDEYLAASWRVVQAERQCDELLRSARRALAREVSDAASLLLGNELAAALEQASDGLLALSYGLREHAFRRIGARP